jgi:hypothetical protein
VRDKSWQTFATVKGCPCETWTNSVNRWQTQRSNRAFLIPPSRLSEIESRGVIPNIHRLYTLSVVYGCTLKKLLAFYGLD